MVWFGSRTAPREHVESRMHSRCGRLRSSDVGDLVCANRIQPGSNCGFAAEPVPPLPGRDHRLLYRVGGGVRVHESCAGVPKQDLLVCQEMTGHRVAIAGPRCGTPVRTRRIRLGRLTGRCVGHGGGHRSAGPASAGCPSGWWVASTVQTHRESGLPARPSSAGSRSPPNGTGEVEVSRHRGWRITALGCASMPGSAVTSVLASDHNYVLRGVSLTCPYRASGWAFHRPRVTSDASRKAFVHARRHPYLRDRCTSRRGVRLSFGVRARSGVWRGAVVSRRPRHRRRDTTAGSGTLSWVAGSPRTHPIRWSR